MRTKERQRGIVLVLTLLVLSILILLVFQMTFTSRVNKHIARNFTDDLQNSYAAKSGYHIALLYLIADRERSADVDSLHETWAQPIQRTIGSSSLTITIEDETRKVNLAAMVKQDGTADESISAMVKRLVVSRGFDEKNVDAIVDYLDADANGDYETGARNGPLVNKDELLRIQGLEEGLLYGIQPDDSSNETKKTEDAEKSRGIMESITIWPPPSPQQGQTPPPPPPQDPPPAPPPEGGEGDGGKGKEGETGGRPPTGPRRGAININTAPEDVLMTLSDRMTTELAQAIVAEREQENEETKDPFVFARVEDIQKVSGITPEFFQEIKPFLTVKSDTFMIRCHVSSGNIRKSLFYVVQRTGDAKKPIKLLYSQPELESLGLPEPKAEE